MGNIYFYFDTSWFGNLDNWKCIQQMTGSVRYGNARNGNHKQGLQLPEIKKRQKLKIVYLLSTEVKTWIKINFWEREKQTKCDPCVTRQVTVLERHCQWSIQCCQLCYTAFFTYYDIYFSVYQNILLFTVLSVPCTPHSKCIIYILHYTVCVYVLYPNSTTDTLLYMSYACPIHGLGIYNTPPLYKCTFRGLWRCGESRNNI